MRKLIALLALAALPVACTDQPTTAVNEASGPELLNVANLDTRGYTLLWSAVIPEEEAWPGSFVSCINGGQGENTVGWGGPYEFWAKVVDTPSARHIENGYIFIPPGGAEYMVGVTSGDVWVTHGLDFLTRLSYRYAPDGSYWMNQPFSQTYTNQRGERIAFRGTWHFQTDANGIPIERNPRLFGEIQVCQVLR